MYFFETESYAGPLSGLTKSQHLLFGVLEVACSMFCGTLSKRKRKNLLEKQNLYNDITKYKNIENFAGSS